MSIVEVARFAGVSKSTVSRVINRSPGVRPEVAKAVLETMDRIGYQPSVRGRALNRLLGREFAPGMCCC